MITIDKSAIAHLWFVTTEYRGISQGKLAAQMGMSEMPNAQQRPYCVTNNRYL
jgi:hypothetical protein